ncbi:MAG: hypothetical protein AB2588_18610 [Candidatus Thiodiazotropha sp.]|nr:hypothetical protein [Candidatus Thiodiazotropha taylori]MBT3060436.1 hypothetical protein [Candidatus Thiodiazotropha sp. (ex Lucina pensylvanica)]MBT3063754.1 hypothetical protein [Candidatus Thiodiazotropha sp. (ex Lucina pensylvanica)]PUB73773.1 MAG: hypothetical protein DBP03_12505 [gamma proteobacterium symbiont of Ctena orbiculata]PUB77571.1 MAG: hypothetical protein DBO99_09265 [gamma proteobacterium symbiont of Ctena orbiculata]
MSDVEHFTHAPEDLKQQFVEALDKTAVEMGRTNSPTDRVDWSAVNDRMIEWWKGKGYEFP